MKDFFGRPLEVGDVVAFMRTDYRDFVRGHIVDFTAKKVRIGFDDQYRQYEETLRFPSEVIKDPMGGRGDVIEQGG